jgi:hypothetical protein
VFFANGNIFDKDNVSKFDPFILTYKEGHFQSMKPLNSIFWNKYCESLYNEHQANPANNKTQGVDKENDEPDNIALGDVENEGNNIEVDPPTESLSNLDTVTTTIIQQIG